MTHRLHASAVAIAGRGALILGASGSGKSSLALQLMAFGATLISDDQTEIWRDGKRLKARAPAAISGLIEARGVGLLKARAEPADIVVAIDLDTVETDRLPPARNITLLDLPVPLLQKVESAAWPAALAQYLTFGRSVPE